MNHVGLQVNPDIGVDGESVAYMAGAIVEILRTAAETRTADSLTAVALETLKSLAYSRPPAVNVSHCTFNSEERVLT